jgi:hypothetical protein
LFSAPLARRAFRKRNGNIKQEQQQPNIPISPNNTNMQLTNLPEKTISQQANSPKNKAYIPLSILAIFVVVIAIFTIGPLSSSAKTDNTNKQIESKSEEAQQIVNNNYSEIKRIINQQGMTYYANSDHDACYEVNIGDKWSGKYETVCAFRKTQFFGFDGDYSTTMIDIEDALITNGWKSNFGINKPIESRLTSITKTRTQTQTQQSSTANTETKLIGSVDFKKGDFELTISDTKKGEKISYDIERSQQVNNAYSPSDTKSSKFQDISTITEEIFSKNQLILVISMEKQYYKSY